MEQFSSENMCTLVQWREEEVDVGVMAGTSEITLLIGQNGPD